MPRVSYVVTVYNKAPYLPFVLDGLASQAGDYDREFIFVNDGSTDDSLGTLRKLTAGWSGLTIIDQANAGPSRALNAGLRAASGDFIKALDGDDMLTPRATETLLEAVRDTGAGVAFGAHDAYRTEDGREQALRHAGTFQSGGKAGIVRDALLATLRNAQTTPSAWLARADLVHRAGGCDPGVFVQDYSIELRLSHATAFARVPSVVFLRPLSAPGRMSEQEAQTLHDVNLAVARFVESVPDLPVAVRRYALRRTAGRAWKHARRHAGKGYGAPEFWRYVRARLGLGVADAAAIRATCAIFRATTPIKLMEPQ
jgi:glycosyltransferase involved in cell wall biosynthesis